MNGMKLMKIWNVLTLAVLVTGCAGQQSGIRSRDRYPTLYRNLGA